MSANLATFRRHDQPDASQVAIIEIDETTLRIYHSTTAWMHPDTHEIRNPIDCTDDP